MLLDVTQGSIFCRLLFNIFHADLILTLNNTEIPNYADITTPYAVSSNKDEWIASLEK